MKHIILHGLLAKKFGKKINIFLNKIENIFSAIDCIKIGFKKEIQDLHNEGYYYSLIEKDKNEIHLIPSIAGSGPLLIVVFFAAVAVASYLGATTLVVSLILAGLQYLIASNMKSPEMTFKQQYQAVGGYATTTQSRGDSYVFQNETNLALQGVVLPIGYGRIKANSLIINFSVRNYPTNLKSEEEFKLLSNTNLINLYD